MSVLEDRYIASITEFFNNNVERGTIVKKDGYPSYPAAVDAIGGVHQVVTHSRGFVADDGTHTNLIERLWFYLKTDIHTRKGVMFIKLENYIDE